MQNREAFTRLAEQYINTVYRVAYAYLRSAADAEDVTQNVLLKLWQSNKKFDSDAHVKHWLIRVTVNDCKKAFLSPWRRETPIEDVADTLAFETPEHSALFYEVMSLPKKYRVPLLLYYYEGYSTADIAQMLHLPPATVRTQLARGRERLKHILQEQEELL